MSGPRVPQPLPAPARTWPTLSRRNIGLGAVVLVVLALAAGLVFSKSPSATNLLQNPSLESATGSTPTCWAQGGYGTNAFIWTRTSDGHTGGFAQTVDITSYTNGDRKFVNTQDAGACAPAVTAGQAYTVTAWYKSTRPSRIFVYLRNTAGSWDYWTQSPNLAAAPSWTQARFTTPPMPANAARISTGMGIEGVGTLTVDDFQLLESASPPGTAAPPGSRAPSATGAPTPTGTNPCTGSVCPSIQAPSN